jgi:glycosyltransferase involved in cell wall biosynthesis
LREALASALAQEYDPLEIVVFDNASTDGTGDLVRGLADKRVRYLRHEANVGAKANFNACVECARGTYFLLLHDDDQIDPGFVAACMAALETAPAGDAPGLIRTGTRVIDARGAVISERRNAASSASVGELARSWFEQRTSMYLPSTLFHTNTLRDVGGFDSPRWVYSDMIAAFRVAARRRVLDVPDVLASFRRHGANLGQISTIEAWVQDSQLLIEVICEGAPEHAPELREQAKCFFTTNNYSRVARLPRARDRILSYWLVYKSFGFCSSPLKYVAQRNSWAWRAWLHGRMA